MRSDDFAILTVTYSGDLESFRDLCASIDRHMPNLVHHVVVDRAERDIFQAFETAQRRVHTAEDFLPPSLQVGWCGKRYRFLPITPPIRGWIWQQLVKLAFTAKATEKALVLVDSDAVFIKPLEASQVIRWKRVRLYRSPGRTIARHQSQWRKVACRVLGLPVQDFDGADYISTAVTWSPAVVRALLARITRHTRLPWYMSLCWRLRFSEYMLYGIFCEFADAAMQEQVLLEGEELCHCSWHYRLDESDLSQFYADIEPHHVAVLIQSNLGMPDQVRRRILDGFAVRTVDTDCTARTVNSGT